MELQLPKGRYVVAVSGGVDSVVLLDVLSKQKNLNLVVAHFDHGIREDSSRDRSFVEELAATYNLLFAYAQGNLGVKASEAMARDARYNFLNEVRKKRAADAIITAHHQDDLLETAIINMLRGTGRKGLASLGSGSGILRPLLGFSKQEILAYAQVNGLVWREDSTNKDTKYLRNYVRHNLITKLTPERRQELLRRIKKQYSINTQLDVLLSKEAENHELPRTWFTGLPHEVAREVMASWLRHNGLWEFDKPAIERAVIGAKTARTGKKITVKKDIFIEVKKDKLALGGKER